MIRRVGGWLFASLCAVAVLAARPPAQAPPPRLAAQLDRYLGGQYDAVVSQFTKQTDFGHLLDVLKHEALPWIAAAPAAERPRRRLVAATYALEAARAAEDEDWKWVQGIDLTAPTLSPVPLITPGGAPPAYRAPPAIWWKTAALLLEWGCELLRKGGAPSPAERWWQLGAVAVAQRRGDYEFMIGSPWDARGNAEDEIEHLKHVIERFPKEPRFALAQAIAIEWHTWPQSLNRSRTASRHLPDALRAFEGMRDDPDIGAEAWLRSGLLLLRANSAGKAVEAFTKVEQLTRDRYLIYLAKFFRGQAHERQKADIDAERDYRGALATIPKAISASMALAALLTRAERPGEASAIVDAAVTANPPPVDPWREYGAADDRFWPRFLSQLRAEIRQ